MRYFIFYEARMPNVYARKTNRASWTEEALKCAAEAVLNEKLSLCKASKQYKIPEKTLRTRIKNKDFSKKPLGPASQLGLESEKKLVKHILQLQVVGFAPTRRDVREIAFNLAVSLGVKHTFNCETKLAGKVWLSSFLRRNTELSVRKAEGISRARTQGMNIKEVSDYFDLLKEVLEKNELTDKPSRIWNADETGIQLNNTPGEVLAGKGSRDVQVVTSSEKGETITVLVCCNAEGQFLPPYCIMRGKYTKPDSGKGSPPGQSLKCVPKKLT